MQRKAVIAGAGPAGLTAAYELLKRTDIVPLILERSDDIGGISKTVNYKGNRIDIGGHRFFSKSNRVMEWWLEMLPLAETPDETLVIQYQNKSHEIKPHKLNTSSAALDKVMLVRERLSRIYFQRSFFDYPIRLSGDTLRKLGIRKLCGISTSYLMARLWPRKPQKSLEDFLVNRFGYKLYELFFKDYTEKVWGVPCDKISAEWGAQRIKGLSITKAVGHALKKQFSRKPAEDIAQKDTETSLIEKFLYPKYGPGQMWEEVAQTVESRGGSIEKGQEVTGILTEGKRVKAFRVKDLRTGAEREMEGDYFFSTMPVKQLVLGMQPAPPAETLYIAKGLQYRDFITVGVLLNKLKAASGENVIKDNWIYIQEKDVKVGRLQIFNNWSPFMVASPDNTVWVGMEYFCSEGDALWSMSDDELKRLAADELFQIGMIEAEDVLDSTVIRMEKSYPAYFGTYNEFDTLRSYLDQFENLFLIGRNGMHKYNNSDHSMLTAMTAVDNIIAGRSDHSNIWAINTEQTYHERKD